MNVITVRVLTSLANTAQSRRNKRRLKTGSFRVWKRVQFCSQCSAILPAGAQYTTEGPAALHHMSAPLVAFKELLLAKQTRAGCALPMLETS